jgi:aryl-alcohol dehydrogenase-like predicted oxidoreductase
MDYVNLGATGLKVSRICLGAMTYGSSKWREWVLDEEASRVLIRQALDAGINFFDTADMYSLGVSEEVLGRALRDFGPGREKLVVATKVFYPMGEDPNQRGLSRKHIRQAIDDSLRRLGTDYVDLYYIHRFDPETPIEETIEALHDVVRAGKVLYLGASTMPMVGRVLSQCRTITILFIAKRSGRWSRSAWRRGLRSSPGVRWRAASWPASAGPKRPGPEPISTGRKSMGKRLAKRTPV